MLKLGCTLPHLANFCSHKSTDAKFDLFTEGDKDILENFREDVVGGLSIVFTRKAVVDETFIRKSANICKSIVGIDVNQLYSYSMCQAMPTGLCRRWNSDSETSKFTPRHNKPRSFESFVKSYFQRTRSECGSESFFITGRQKKLTTSVFMGFVLIATMCLKPWVAFTTSVPAKSCVLFSLKRIFKVVAKRKSRMH